MIGGMSLLGWEADWVGGVGELDGEVVGAEECEAGEVGTEESWTVFKSLSCLEEDAVSEDEASSSLCISSLCRPFFSRKATFFSRGASRTDGSSRNILAWSRTVLRSGAGTDSPASFEVFEEVSDVLCDIVVCQAGIEGGLESDPFVIVCSRCWRVSRQ